GGDGAGAVRIQPNRCHHLHPRRASAWLLCHRGLGRGGDVAVPPPRRRRKTLSSPYLSTRSYDSTIPSSSASGMRVKSFFRKTSVSNRLVAKAFTIAGVSA